MDAGFSATGRTKSSGKKIFSGTGFTLPALPNGYYKLEVAGIPASRSFAVVPDPEKREKNPDLFFAVDSAQSWLAAPQKENPFRPADAFAIVSEVARRAGIQMVRERLRWSDVEPEPGKFDWKQYRLNADLLSERGIRISGVYHDAPSWTRSNTPRLPSDLMANYRFARKLAREFRGKMTVWEFWNEPDIGFAPEGAWDYAAALKSAYLGFKAGDPELTVAPGGYARTPLLNYNHVVLLNGAGDYADIFNMHTYAVIRDFPAVLQDIRNHLKCHNLTHLPIWFTENGSNMEGAAREESGIKGRSKTLPRPGAPGCRIYRQNDDYHAVSRSRTRFLFRPAALQRTGRQKRLGHAAARFYGKARLCRACNTDRPARQRGAGRGNPGWAMESKASSTGAETAGKSWFTGAFPSSIQRRNVRISTRKTCCPANSPSPGAAANWQESTISEHLSKRMERK